MKLSHRLKGTAKRILREFLRRAIGIESYRSEMLERIDAALGSCRDQPEMLERIDAALGSCRDQQAKIIHQTIQSYNFTQPHQVDHLDYLPVQHLPTEKDSYYYMLEKNRPDNLPTCKLGLPVPPKSLWAEYGNTEQEYLSWGETDVSKMLSILSETGWVWADHGRALEFGCAAGRMVRWLKDLAETHEIWGLDISAKHVQWCQSNLTPPFHFATTTVVPHLPFEDRYFDFVFAGSVFTHMEDLAMAWFLELRRVIRPGGRLYVTIHDRNTVELLKKDYQHLLNFHMLEHREDFTKAYYQYTGSEFGMFTIGRSIFSRVFYDMEYLERMLSPAFRTLRVEPKAYGPQTALLLERR
jgi:SAM-dependent methyltransferase